MLHYPKTNPRSNRVAFNSEMRPSKSKDWTRELQHKYKAKFWVHASKNLNPDILPTVVQSYSSGCVNILLEQSYILKYLIILQQVVVLLIVIHS